MKKLFYPAIFIMAIAFSSCEKDYVTDVTQNEQFAEKNIRESIGTSDLSSIASILSHISINNDICKEVHEAVSSATDNGLDESYYFQEILKEGNNKIATRSGNPSSLGTLIKNYFANPITRSADADAINLDLLAKSDIQIYWPYSEDWDGKTLPAITYAPEDEDQEWNYAYKKNGDKIDTIIVNEEYMEKNPVWIINKSDISYEDLPNLSLKQNVKNNVLFLSETNENKNIDNLPYITRATGEPVYTVYLGQFMAEKQYDKIWSGGSEFAIQMGAIENMQIESIEQLKSANPQVTYLRITRSRKDIKKKRWITLNSVLSSDWYPNENNAAFMIHEEDQGKNINWEADLSIKIKGKDFGFKAKLPFGSHDDLVYRTVYKRTFVFSTNNKEGNNWTVHKANGVSWTLPYKIGFTLN